MKLSEIFLVGVLVATLLIAVVLGYGDYHHNQQIEKKLADLSYNVRNYHCATKK